MLTYRERFARTRAHQAVDRPPMDLGATDMTGVTGGPRRLAGVLGLDPLAADADEAVLQALDIDFRSVGGILSPASPLAQTRANGDQVDCWGVVRRCTGHSWEIVENPLRGAALAALERFPWPDPARLDRAELRRFGAEARRLHDATPYVVVARHPVYGVLELGCWMCGFDDFLARLAIDPEFVERFFACVWAYQRRVQELYFAEVGAWCHLTTSGDDFGSQTAPLLSPAMFRRLVQPRLAERFAHIRTLSRAAIFHHTCGAVRPLIPDLIAAGVEVLNPIQPNAAGMDPAGLKRDFGDRLCFYGGVDTQELLPHGDPIAVAAAVRRLVATIGRDGGYILSPAHILQSDVPASNAVALYQAGACALAATAHGAGSAAGCGNPHGQR
jgi:uroporphyrinogen decarboxylase